MGLRENHDEYVEHVVYEEENLPDYRQRYHLCPLTESVHNHRHRSEFEHKSATVQKARILIRVTIEG